MLRSISWIALILSGFISLFYYAPGFKYRWPLSTAIELWPYLCIIPCLGFLLSIALPNWRKRRIRIGLASSFLVVSLAPVFSWIGFPTASPATGMRVMSYNLWIGNQNHAAIAQVIRAEDPDILSLSEISQPMMDELVSRLDYANYYRTNGRNNALFANDERVTVIGVHPPVPIFRKFFHARNQQLDSFARASQEIEGNIILLGDFNATPWSPYFQRFERLSQLDNAGIGQGLWATWYFNQIPKARPIKIPIDRVETRGFTPLNAWVGATGGSDHKPVVTVLRAERGDNRAIKS